MYMKILLFPLKFLFKIFMLFTSTLMLSKTFDHDKFEDDVDKL